MTEGPLRRRSDKLIPSSWTSSRKALDRPAAVGTARMSSTSSKAPRTSILNSSPESTVIVGGVRVLTEKRYSVGFGLIFRPEALQTAGPDSSTSFGNEAILGPTRLIG